MRGIVFALLMAFSFLGLSQDYPVRPVRVLVGYPPSGGSTPEELRAQIAEEMKRWAAVVKDAGNKLE
jgi:tripartite-type tricarboxylate transporter receptor subunit TctC